MSDEKLEFANVIKERIDKLDDEIYKIMDICPAVRSAENLPKYRRGIIRAIKGMKLIYRNSTFTSEENEIELSNEDCRVLINIRTAEREALQQVLSSL